MNKATLVRFFETLDKDVPVEAFGTLYDNAVVFRDPFNDVKGIRAVYRIFQEMYQNLDEPRFVIREYIESASIAYVKWDFQFHFKGDAKESRFEGVSRLELNAEGKIVSHADFWDAAEHIYEKIPLLGSMLRFVKRKIAGK
jgi:hypothetical protein